MPVMLILAGLSAASLPIAAVIGYKAGQKQPGYYDEKGTLHLNVGTGQAQGTNYLALAAGALVAYKLLGK